MSKEIENSLCQQLKLLRKPWDNSSDEQLKQSVKTFLILLDESGLELPIAIERLRIEEP